MLNTVTLNLYQRIAGVIALGLLTLQIYLSSNPKLIKYHKINGILTYSFVSLHPLLFVAYNYFLYRRIDPLYVFVDACVLCSNTREYLINLGRIAFYLVTAAVFAVKFNFIDKWLQANWRKIHVLNYFAFYVVSLHAVLLGSDFGNKLFLTFFVICQIVVLRIAYKKLKTFIF